MGARAYRFVDRVVARSGEIAVEIGTDRGEGSTPFLREWCHRAAIPFISVDIDPEREPTVVADGAEWLRGLRPDVKICFAYLDNFDFIYPEIERESWVELQRADYEKLGLHLTNENSARAHLTQAQLIHAHTEYGAFLVLDDTWAGFDGYHGKGAFAVPWLLQRGWRVELAYGERWDGFFALRRAE